MSKDRARRRAEREAAQALARRRAERHRARVRRTRAVRAAVTHPVAALRPGPAAQRPAGRARRPVSTALGRHRARQNGLLAAVLLGAHTLLWLFTASWWVRGSALVLTALAWPLLLVLFFDRRPTS